MRKMFGITSVGVRYQKSMPIIVKLDEGYYLEKHI